MAEGYGRLQPIMTHFWLELTPHIELVGSIWKRPYYKPSRRDKKENQI